MSTRTISYIDSNEDLIELEIQKALQSPIASHLEEYSEAIAAQCAMLGVDIKNSPNSRRIYFVDEEY